MTARCRTSIGAAILPRPLRRCRPGKLEELKGRGLPMRDHTVRPSVVMALLALGLGVYGSAPVAGQEGFRFRSGVELINVTATVTDRSGRFIAGLTRDDFIVYEDNQPVEITHFSAERSPVSLGLVIDTSGSMAGEKWNAAMDAIDRF